MACTSPKIVVGGITISTSDFENAKEILATVSGDDGDPTLDEYDENIANGNNGSGRTGVQFPPSAQTSPPGAINEKPEASDNSPPPYRPGVSVVCVPWSGDYNQSLSPNFTVKDFTSGAYYPNRIQVSGPAADLIVCNLQALAVNIAENMRTKFGNFRINSGLRNSNSGTSQHLAGEAMDIQFIGWSYSKYWDNAIWIKNNIPYDQFIFEHSITTGLAWYHLSFKRSGNRPSSSPNKVMTMYKNKYLPGLYKFG